MGGINTAFNYFENIFLKDVSQGLVLDGNHKPDPAVASDSTQNVFVNLQIVYRGTNTSSEAKNNMAIWLKHCDANSFYRVSTFRDQSYGYGVVINSLPGSDPPPGGVNDIQDAPANYFYDLAAAPGGVFINKSDKDLKTDPTGPDGKNFILGYRQGLAGTVPPETDNPNVKPEKILTWLGTNGDANGFRVKHYSISSPLTAANWPLVDNNQMATCFDTANFWLLVQEGGNKWKLQMTQLT